MLGKLSSLEDRIEPFETAIEKINDEQSKQSKEIQTLRNEITETKCNLASSAIKEVQDRTQRSNNIIIRELPETFVSLDERTDKDERRVKRIFETLILGDIAATEVRRLGKTNGKALDWCGFPCPLHLREMKQYGRLKC